MSAHSKEPWTRHRLHEIALMLAMDDAQTAIDGWEGVAGDEVHEIIAGHQRMKVAFRKELELWKSASVDIPTAAEIAALRECAEALRDIANSSGSILLPLDIQPDNTPHTVAAKKIKAAIAALAKLPKPTVPTA